MKLVLVEDDEVQVDEMLQCMERAFRGCAVRHIRTESQFMRQLDDIILDRPDVIIMDVMLPWTDNDEMLPPPPEWSADGKNFRAGIRCVKAMRADSSGSSIPIVLYTILDESDLKSVPLDDVTVHFKKRDDWTPLLDQIRSVCSRR